MPKIKILHYLPWIHSGGVERRRLLLARGLDSNRFEQRVVFLHGLDHLVRDFESAGAQLSPLGGRLLGSASLVSAAAIAREWKPDIVHGAVFEGVIMAAAAGLAHPRAKVIFEEIGYPVERDVGARLRRSWRGRLLFRLLTLRADRCVAVSPAIEEYLTSEGVPARKRRLIMNAAPEPRLPPPAEWGALRRELGIPDRAFVVGSVGRLHDAHKRFSDLLAAMRILLPRHPDLHLLIVGDGGDRQQLESMAAALEVRHAVTFTGYRADVGPMYAAMDVFALVSEREAFGLVLVEAMFANLPAIGTRTSGIANVVDDGRTGLLVGVRSPAEIAGAVESLKADPDRRRAMGEAGRERAVRLFSPARYIAEVARMYEGVLGDREADVAARAPASVTASSR